MPTAPAQTRLSTADGRWILVATILASSMALLDGTVVNVALPALGDDLDASLAGLQWTINAYMLTLAGLILVGGSLGDRLGRRRVLVVGVVWFAVASLMCGLAPTIEWLVGSRALQGVGAALLTPGSLALIQASFHRDDRVRAVGIWAGWGGVAAAVGPFVGGWLIDGPGWRWIFLLNAPLALVVVLICLRHVPESRDDRSTGGFDVTGACLAALALAGITYALIEAPDATVSPAVLWAAAAGGVLAALAFVVVQRRRTNPMLPLDIFTSRQFSGVNIATLLIYAALGAVSFLLVVQLQTVAGYSALAAGLAMLPATLLLLTLSGQAGRLAERVGPRLPMTVGPLVAALGVWWMASIGRSASYALDVLAPGVVFGAGLTITVAPLTATVLATVATRRAGVASGVNNAVARAGSLLAVAAIPFAVGLSGEDYRTPERFDEGYGTAMLLCAALLVAGAAVSWFTITRDALKSTPDEQGDGPDEARSDDVKTRADDPTTTG